MPIESTCAGCGQILRVADEHRGKLAKCPSCGTVYRVGETSGTKSPVEPTKTEFPPDPGPIDPFAKLDGRPESSDVSPKLAPIAMPIPQPVSSEDARAKSYLAQTPDGKVYGPTDYATLEKWISEGRLNTQCLVKSTDQGDWQSMGQLFGGRNVNPYAASYNAVGGPQMATAQPTGDRSAIILTLGILSWFICCVGQICAIVAVVLGYQDLRPERTAMMSPNAKTMTQVGFYLALVNLIFGLIGFGFYFLMTLFAIVAEGGNF